MISEDSRQTRGVVMPFIAVCPYCQKGKIRAPENAVGWSAECPNPDCGSFFTLTQPAKGQAQANAQPAPLASMGRTQEGSSEPVAIIDPAAATIGTIVQQETTPEFTPAPTTIRRVLPRARSLPNPVRNPFAAVSLLLGSTGLVCASLPTLEIAALPLAGAGLVIGLVGILFAIGKEIGLGLASTGPLVSAATLVAIICMPGLLDIYRGMQPSREADDPHRRTVIPLSRGGGEGRTLADSEWVDASTGTVQVGDAWVRITNATVEHVGLQAQGQRSLSSEKYLVLRLQLANNGVRRRVDYQTWAHTRTGPSKHRVRLLDPAGKTVPQATFTEGEPVGQLASGSMYPGKSLDDFLIFVVPSGKLEYLQLELSASAFGGEGSVQFQVPRSMIKVR